jgi:glycosyltransferase involved in cell wall biosynthesis
MKCESRTWWDPGPPAPTAPALRAVEIVASISNKAAGPSYSVPRLAEALASAGAEVELFSLGSEMDELCGGVRRRRFPQSLTDVPVVSQLQASAPLNSALIEAGARVDVLHTHGLWLMPNVYPAAAARRAGKLFVLSPRGMLGEAALAFSRRRKQLFWTLLQGRAARSAGLMHATSDAEADEIRAARLTAPIAVIPNGIDTPTLVSREAASPRTVLSLGRIHPKKGLDRLIRAWSGVPSEGWRLRIVGPSEREHADQLRSLAAGLSLANVDIEGPVFGCAKLAAYRSADLFILPTLNENFAMTVAEALAAGVPVICTKGAPWGGLEREACGWWVDHGEEQLAAALRRAMALPWAELSVMGARGYAWMKREFSWEAIGRDMLAAYDWAIRGGPPPATVRL